jgi:hypothetical protein
MNYPDLHRYYTFADVSADSRNDSRMTDRMFWAQPAADAVARLNANSPRYNGKLLLADIRRVFAEASVERIFSADLASALCSLADRPYSYPDNLKPKGIVVTAAWLGHRLQPYGVRPRTVRIGEDRAKGYELRQFEAAFKKHLNGEGNGAETKGTQHP